MLGTIVWATSRNGKWDIYKMNSDGSDKVRLTNDQEQNDHPVWSKDGEWIYYERNEDIYRMRPDGSNSQLVVVNGSEPDISWDNEKLVYIVEEEVNGSEKTSIMLLDLETGTTEEIVPANTPGLEDYAFLYPTLSPDGERIAFASTYPDPWYIHIMELDGSNRFEFTFGCQPHYHPDGLMLVWITSGYHEVYIGTSDGINQELFEDSIPGRPHCYFSKWSNNGEYIVFAASPDFDHNTSDYEIYIKPVNGGEAERLTFHPGTDKWPDLYFPDHHTLTIATSPGGTTDPSPGTHFYEVNAEVSIKATADMNYTFSNWSGDATGTTNPVIITMDSDKTVTANFTLNTYTLTTGASPTAGGSVAIDPDQTSYNHGTNVQLTAAASTDYTFSGWSGDATGTTNPVTITMDSNKTVTANFTLNTCTLTTGASPTAGGSVAIDPDLASYNHGTNVQLTAAANTGYTFSGWGGDASGTTNPVTITMDSNKTVTANFTLNTYALTTEASPTTGGSVAIDPDLASYNHGTNVQLTATVNTGYAFTSWSGDASGSANSITITMDSDKSIKANFERIVYPPLNFAGKKELNRSLFFAEYINTLTWLANPDNQDIVTYRIYQVRRGTQRFVVEVKATTFMYLHRNVGKNIAESYAIEAVNRDGLVSAQAFITVQQIRNKK